MTTTLQELLLESISLLDKNGVPDSLRDSRLLMSFATGKPASFVRAHPEYVLNKDESRVYRESITRRSNREPLQHIVGNQEFYGTNFLVSKDVLVPRPETELLVETAIELFKDQTAPRILELGTGSGCIAVSILKHLESAKVVASDISSAALAIADKNAESNSVRDRIDFVESDLFESLPLQSGFDLIISNPPYIPAADIEKLEPEVRDFDPHNALTDGADGFGILRRIVTGAETFLDPGGYLLMEFGYGQSNEVIEMFESGIWQVDEVKKDLRSIPRIVVARIRLKTLNKR